MVDITMCRGVHCKDRENCYRFKATPNPFRQSYFVETPVLKLGLNGPKCENYIKYHGGS